MKSGSLPNLFFSSAQAKIDPNDLATYVDPYTLQQHIPGQLLSQASLNYVRKKQIMHKMASATKLINQYFPSKSSDPSSPLEFPVVIGRNGEAIVIYEKNKLGGGAYGEVFIGMNLDTGKVHAIKYQNAKTSNEKAVVEHEENVLAGLNRLIDAIVISQNGRSLITQEYIEGENLRVYKNSEYNDPPTEHDFAEKCEIAIQLLQRLHELHTKEYTDKTGKQQKGFVHRDVKLDNAIWDGKKLQLIDFGETRPLDENAQCITRHGGGTMYALAPELVFSFGELIYTPATDMYAAGIFIAELVSKEKTLGLNSFEEIEHIGALDAQRDEIKHKQTHNPCAVKAVAPLMERKAKDVFTDDLQKETVRAEFNQLIRSMCDVQSKNRPDFLVAISILKEIKSKLPKPLTPQRKALLAEIDVLKKLGESLKEMVLEQRQNKLKSSGIHSTPLDRCQQQECIKSFLAISALLQTYYKEINRSLLHRPSRHSNSKRTILMNYADRLLHKIHTILFKNTIEADDILEVSIAFAKIRGKVYARGLHHVTDTEKTTKTGYSKKLDLILVKAEELLVVLLKSTPDFKKAMDKYVSKKEKYLSKAKAR
ncbi:MAG: protein kinase family protein [Proteobacteria bacterium]|nr:protein kinase family protein [Pseudomonadota bacterium]